MEKLIVKRTENGWELVQSKTKGMNKGDIVLATVCGGNMGLALIKTILKQVADMTMIYDIVIED